MMTFASTTMCLLILVRDHYTVRLAYYRKEVPPDTSLFRYYRAKHILAEQLFIFIHPNILTCKVKIWAYEENLNNYYFYHLNDIFSIIMSLKV